METDEKVLRVIEEAHRRNVSVTLCEDADELIQFGAPAHTGGINMTRRIFWVPNQGHLSAEALLHEVTHVRLWNAFGQNPDAQSEMQEFLWLEYEANRRLKLLWDEWMHPVETRYGTWGMISSREKRTLLLESRALCERRGWVENPNLTPKRRK